MNEPCAQVGTQLLTFSVPCPNATDFQLVHRSLARNSWDGMQPKLSNAAGRTWPCPSQATATTWLDREDAEPAVSTVTPAVTDTAIIRPATSKLRVRVNLIGLLLLMSRPSPEARATIPERSANGLIRLAGFLILPVSPQRAPGAVT